jgi:hypothetical protein
LVGREPGIWRKRIYFLDRFFNRLGFAIVPAKDKPTYSEHGKVVAMRTDKAVKGGGVYTVNGETHGGRVKTYNVAVFKIRTDTMDYEVEGNPALSVDEEIAFRIVKGRKELYILIQRGDKEKRYSVVTQEKR